MKTVIFGGSFNPFHNGHMQLSREVIKTVEPDRFIIVPSHIPPHKAADSLLADSDRLEMCRLAAAEIGSIASASDFEIISGGKSYTVYTLEYFHSVYPESDLYFAMGSDMLKSFLRWYMPERIMELATIVCNCRDENDREDIKTAKEEIETRGGRCILTACPALILSSTDVRKKLFAGASISSLVPASVAEYIERKGLYRA